MTADMLTSLPDSRDLPLDDEVPVSDAEYDSIMRRIGRDGAEPSVSAFNSSI